MSSPIPKARGHHFVFKRIVASYAVENPVDFFYSLAPDEVGPENLKRVWDLAGERVKPEELIPPEGLASEKLWVNEHPGLMIRLPKAIGSNEAYFMLAIFGVNDEEMVESCVMFALEKCDPQFEVHARATMLVGWDSNGRFSMGNGPDENDDLAVTEKEFHEQVVTMLQQRTAPIVRVPKQK